MEAKDTTISQMISKSLEQFGERAKQAADLAPLLDSGLLDPAKGARVAKERKKVLDILRAICQAVGVTPPPAEEATLRALIPEVREEVHEEAGAISALIQQKLEGLSGTEAAADLLALGRVIRLLPSLLREFDSDSRCSLLASADLLFMSLGQDALGAPTRSEKMPAPARLPQPSRPLKVLIVDDCVDEIVRTVLALAGGPGLEIEPLHVAIEWGIDRQQALKEAAAAVLARGPDIVFMDQGMPVISGSDLIRTIRGLMTKDDDIVFIASTGGSPQDLHEAGAIGSSDKGRDLSPMFQAISHFAG